MCVAALLMMPLTPVWSQETPERSAPSASGPAENGNAVGNAVGSFFNRLKAAVKDDKPANTDTGKAAPAAQAASSEDNVKAGKTGNSDGFNIIDIDSWSKTSNVLLDPQCKTLIQPFGLSDNMASLAVLATKLNVNNFLGKLQGNATPPMSVKDIVKLAARQLNWLPMEAELLLGQQMLSNSEILEEEKNKDTRRVYAEARLVLAEIVQFLPTPLPYDFQIRVLTKSSGNAAALPGGIILVDRDLFKKGADRDFAYFVIAHEVSHVLQRHETRAYQARLADGIESLDGLRNLLSAASNKNPGAVLSYGAALKKLFINFTEQQELQADSCAVRLMSQRYPDSKLMAAKLKKVELALGPITADAPPSTEGPQGNTVIDQIKYLADGVMERHPHTQQRRKNLQSTLSVSFTVTGAAASPLTAVTR